MRLAIEDLATRLGLETEEIEVLDVQVVEWPDASLGCPQPGAMYAQVVTPGFDLMLGAGRNRYEYHTDSNESVVLCEEQLTMTEPSEIGNVEPGLESFVRVAKDDLALRLAVDADEIEVVEARSVVWPDGSLGCPQPGMSYTQVPVDGVLIELSAAGRVHAYHGGGGRSPFLCESSLRVPESPPKAEN